MMKIIYLRDRRKQKEKGLIKSNKDVFYPDYETLKAEMDEDQANLLFTIKNSENMVVKKVLRSQLKD